MKKILLYLIIYFSNQVSFAQTVELICEGEIETRLINYKGGGKAYWTSEIKLEVSIDNNLNLIKKVFSKNLLLSLCYLDDSMKDKCTQQINNDYIEYSFNHEIFGQSLVKINRKTGIALILENSSHANLSDSSMFTERKRSEIECKKFDKNKF